MLSANAYRLASQRLEYLAKLGGNHALRIVGGPVARTPNTDWDCVQMLSKGAKLVGVFNQGMPRRELAEAIMAADE